MPERAREFLKHRPHWPYAAGAAVLLVAGLADWPYGYYVFLRWTVTVVAAFVGFVAYTWKGLHAVWPFGVIAILFNPLVPVHLSREIWAAIDLVVAAAFLVSIFIVRCPPRVTE